MSQTLDKVDLPWFEQPPDLCIVAVATAVPMQAEQEEEEEEEGRPEQQLIQVSK